MLSMGSTTISAWKALTPPIVEFQPLDKDLEIDVAIVGGGITSVTAAHELINKNKKVAILEALQLGNGTTGFSTGNLYIAIQPYFQTILKKFNEKTAINVINSRAFAI